VVLIFLTTREWYGVRAAWIAAALAGLTGLFTFYEVLLLQSSIDAFFAAAALYALSRRAHLLAGCLFGLHTLNRPNVLIAAVAVGAVLLLVRRRVRPVLALALGLCLGLAPVAIRNVLVTGEFTLVSSHGGLNFYIGNGEHATGFYRIVPGVTPSIVGQEKDTRRIAERQAGRPLTDAEVSDFFFDGAWTWIEQHPGAALGLFVKKLAFVFHAQHLPLPHSYPFFAYDTPSGLRYLVIGPWLLVPLGLVGLFAAANRARRDDYIVWAAFVPAYAAAVAVFFVAERYRLPLLVPLCSAAGAAIDLVARKLEARRWTSAAVVIAAAAVVAVAVNWRVRLDDGRWIEGLRLVERLLIAGRYEEADRWGTWLQSHGEPRPGAGAYGVGTQLLALEQPARALPYLERAHRANPADGQHEFAFGQALLKTGRAAEALPHLQRGFEAGVELPAGGLDYAVALKETGDLAGTLAAIRRIQPADNADAEAWMRFGRLASEAKAPDVAEPFFRRAVELAPSNAAARQQYGLNLLLLTRHEAAARELAEAARLNPRDADSLAHLAYCELQLGRRVEARAHVEQALALDPEQPLARRLAAAVKTP
jgi:tetratricopeptide (TPR) repeat protein